MEEMYTVKEVAELLKISEGTVRNYMSSGKVKYVKFLGNARITKEELEKHIKLAGQEEGEEIEF